MSAHVIMGGTVAENWHEVHCLCGRSWRAPTGHDLEALITRDECEVWRMIEIEDEIARAPSPALSAEWHELWKRIRARQREIGKLIP